MFTDTHCHLNRLDLTKYDGQLSGAIDAMKAANVTRAMAIMCDFAEYDDIAHIVSTHSDEVLELGMSVGIHPCEDITVLQSATTERLIQTADAEHVWAIGETGLDYYWSTENKKEQQASLARHIYASQQLKKPLVVHMRDAKKDTLDILKAEGAEHGIIHCFTEDWETAKRALDLGFYISFSGIVSFKSAQMIQDAARKMPKDRILIETDSPYLAPVPKRGKPNEPAYVPYVARYLAQMYECDSEEVGALTAKNFENLLAQYC
ncbi:TatD family hydrolase [Psychrobacter celer]|uniref:TatD family hydrolase n=1 Tax=Psychrobacter halodurans TaxID=2818439 RepID=A0AAW4IKR6_9GAMM|nr:MULTISPECIES: TatD family hydrolase [Psychrobacter]MBO1515799.1 TatD family hydrolase [Psychrobacter halodurans]MDN5733997.1 TatD family hydrolase [Psychrobacter sp.]OLF40705.1 TatD family deoxyribonuclease [Psychrobacter sp. Rd 27.2]PJX24380.1 TatD family deoxyribonuclease [Psychrobacter sp. L7]